MKEVEIDYILASIQHENYLTKHVIYTCYANNWEELDIKPLSTIFSSTRV